MRTHIVITLVSVSLVLSACQFAGFGAAPVPTLSLVEMQATAQALAQAAVAQTMAAMPTATATSTPVPTPTPPPTADIVPSPTMAALVIPTATKAASGVDPCNYTPISTVKGPHVDVVVTAVLKGGTSQVRYFLRETAFGCGYGVLSMSGMDSTTISIPVGCYDIYGMYYGKNNDHFYTYACFERKIGTYYARLYPEMMHFSTAP